MPPSTGLKSAFIPGNIHLASLPLRDFESCLNANDYSSLANLDADLTASDFTAFETIPNAGIITKMLTNDNFNFKWVKTLTAYLLDVGCINENDYCATISELIALHVELGTCAFNISILHTRYSPAAAKYLTERYGVEISERTLSQDLNTILGKAQSRLARYNWLCAKYQLIKPMHSKATFIKTIAEAQKHFKLFPEDVSPERIFDGISTAEYIQYLLSLRSK